MKKCKTTVKNYCKRHTTVKDRIRDWISYNYQYLGTGKY